LGASIPAVSALSIIEKPKHRLRIILSTCVQNETRLKFISEEWFSLRV
jgi:hypothetical protein